MLARYIFNYYSKPQNMEKRDVSSVKITNGKMGKIRCGRLRYIYLFADTYILHMTLMKKS